MKAINDFVDQVYCIHDISSNERHEVYENLKTINPKYVFADRPYSGFTTSSFQYAGVFGNTLSHLKVLTDALISGHKNAILVLEDDVSIRKSVDGETILSNALKNLPNDWGILYLNGNPLDKVTNVKDTLYESKNIVCVFSYILNMKHIEKLIQYYIDSMGKESPRCICDAIIRDYFIENGMSQYCVYPFVINHNEGIATARDNEHRKYGENFFEQQWKKAIS